MKKKILCGVCAAVLALSLTGCVSEEYPTKIRVVNNFPFNHGNTTTVDCFYPTSYTIEETDEQIIITIVGTK